MNFDCIARDMHLEGNQPLLLWQEKKAYFVKEGVINIFAVKQHEHQIVGKREFILQIHKGQLFFASTELLSAENYGFIACGGLENQVQEMPLEAFHEHLFTLSMDEIMQIIELLQRWEGGLLKAIDITSRYELHGMEDDPIVALEKFHRTTVEKIQNKFLEIEKSEQERLKGLKQQEEKNLTETVHILAGAFENKQETEDFYSYRQHPLLGAYKEICKVTNMTYDETFEMREGLSHQEARERLKQLAHVKMRRVVLKNEWWKHDTLPMIAYLKDQDVAVALIAKDHHKYELFNPVTRERLRVEGWINERLTGEAYCIYRLFDDAPMQPIDLVKWCLKSCEKQDFLILGSMGLLGSLVGVAIPYATGVIFNQIIPRGELNLLMQLGALFIVILLGELSFNFAKDVAMLRIEGKIDFALQAAFWERLLSLPSNFFREYKAGDLGSRIMSIKELRAGCTKLIGTVFFSGAFLLTNYLLLMYYDVKLAVIIGLIMLGVLMIGGIGQSILFKQQREILNQENHLSGILYQYINGISKLRSSGSGGRAIKEWAHHYKEIHLKRWKFLKNEQNHEMFFKACPVVITGYMFFYMTYKSKLSVGDMIGFNAALSKSLSCVLALVLCFKYLNQIKNLYKNVAEIFTTPKEYIETLPAIEGLTGEIDIGAVSFAYEEDGPMILKDINVRINPGEYVAIVGPSGSGKTTLFRLLLGFDHPTYGGIYYNGKDINKVDIRSVRRQIGVVLQNGQLIPDTIYHNIIGENSQLTIEDAIEAAKMAGIYEDIEEMPMGMHTMISEGAKNISGGQKQRILIARAIVNKPRILYFDEATSALDNNTQDIVSRSLYRLNTTRIVIAHRLSTIRKCDRIIVLDRGVVKEEGDFETLMAQKGVFYKMATRQI